jgi:OFA family oxalate/formate antiporter-like MFS transporter
LLFLNVSAGIMIISQASPMAQEMVGMAVIRAAGMVGLIPLCNGLGRVFWAWVSDHIGRARVYFLLFLIQVIIFFLLPRIHDLTLQRGIRPDRPVLWSGFGTMPPFTADSFGAKSMGGIYGFILLAWGLAAIPSPIMIVHIHQSIGKYSPAIDVITVVMLCSLILPLIARRPSREPVSASASSVLAH